MLVQHHTKYKEIHGVDEIVLMRCGEHIKHHNRLRKAGCCKIPPDVTHDAHLRSPKHKETTKRYTSNHQRKIKFYNSVGENVRLVEEIQYNLKTGVLSIYSYLLPSNEYKLFYIDDISRSDNSAKRVSQEVLPERSGSSSPLKG